MVLGEKTRLRVLIICCSNIAARAKLAPMFLVISQVPWDIIKRKRSKTPIWKQGPKRCSSVQYPSGIYIAHLFSLYGPIRILTGRVCVLEKAERVDPQVPESAEPNDLDGVLEQSGQV